MLRTQTGCLGSCKVLKVLINEPYNKVLRQFNKGIFMLFFFFTKKKDQHLKG